MMFFKDKVVLNNVDSSPQSMGDFSISCNIHRSPLPPLSQPDE